MNCHNKTKKKIVCLSLTLLLTLSVIKPLWGQIKQQAKPSDTSTVIQNHCNKLSLSDWTNCFQIVSSIAAVIALSFGIYQIRQLRRSNEASTKQLRLLQKSNKAEIVIGLFNEFRDTQFHAMREKIRRQGKNTKFEEVVDYSHMLNHFGFLLEHGYVDIQSLYDMMARSVFVAWDALSVQIKEKRSANKDPLQYYPYQYHFEFLNYELRKYATRGREHIDKLLAEMETSEAEYLQNSIQE